MSTIVTDKELRCHYKDCRLKSMQPIPLYVDTPEVLVREFLEHREADIDVGGLAAYTSIDDRQVHAPLAAAFFDTFCANLPSAQWVLVGI